MYYHPDRPSLAEAEADDRICGRPNVSQEVRDMVNGWYNEAMEADKIRLTAAQNAV